MGSFHRIGVIRAVFGLFALLATSLLASGPAPAANTTVAKKQLYPQHSTITRSPPSKGTAIRPNGTHRSILADSSQDRPLFYMFAGTAPSGEIYYSQNNLQSPQSFTATPNVSFSYLAQDVSTFSAPSDAYPSAVSIYLISPQGGFGGLTNGSTIYPVDYWDQCQSTTVSGGSNQGNSKCLFINFQPHADLNEILYSNNEPFALNPYFHPENALIDTSPVYYDVLSVWYQWNATGVGATPDLYYVFRDGTFSSATPPLGVASLDVTQIPLYNQTLPDSYAQATRPLLFGAFGSGTLIISPVADQSGKQLGLVCPCLGDPIDPQSGNEFEQFTDYTTSGANPLQFIRYYNSRAAKNSFASSLGMNWRTNFDRYLHLITTGTTLSVIAERPDGKMLTFNWSKTANAWTPDTDVDVTLTQSGSTWTLTDSNDTKETYVAGPIYPDSVSSALVTTITARNGYQQTLSYDSNYRLQSVTDTYKRTLTFTNPTGLLQNVTTPDNTSISYSYNASGNAGTLTNDRLYQVTYADGKTNTYSYGISSQPFALTGIQDELGNQIATITYDLTGRATSSQEAGGVNRVTIGYDDTTGARTVTKAVTDTVSEQYTYQTAISQGVPKISSIVRGTGTNQASQTTTYDNNGYIASQTDWNGNKTIYTNNSHGMPTEIDQVITQNPYTAVKTTISYDTTWGHLPAKIVTDGLITTFTYDGSGEVLTKTESDTTTTTISYTNAAGNPVTYSTNGKTRTWTYTWANSLLASVTGPRSDVTQKTIFTYQSSTSAVLATVKKVVNATSKTILAVNTFTAGGLPLQTQDTNGLVTNYHYDARQRLYQKQVVATEGTFTTTYTLDGRGDLIKSTALPDGSTVRASYNAARQLQSVTDGLSEVASYTYDLLGDRLSTQYSTAATNGTTTYNHSYQFDPMGRLTGDLGASGQSTTYTLDNNGNPTSVIQALTSSSNRTTTKSYDQFNRLISVTNPDNHTAYFTYDTHNRPLTIKDYNGVTTIYIYDGFGDVIGKSSPDIGYRIYYYDAAGNVTQETFPQWSTATPTPPYVCNCDAQVFYTYDELNRRLSETHTNQSRENATFTYDGGTNGFGHLTSMTDQAGSLTRSYDQRGNLLSETRTHPVFGSSPVVNNVTTTAFAYDNMSRVIQIGYPSGFVVTYDRDAAGHIDGVFYYWGTIGISNIPAPQYQIWIAYGITRNPFGPILSIRYENWAYKNFKYDLDYRLSNMHADGNTPWQDHSYTYNLTNTLNGLSDGTPWNAAFSSESLSGLSYDNEDRLLAYTATENSVATSYQFGYDNNGNRISQSVNGSNTIAATIASGTNRVVGLSNPPGTTPYETYTYDLAGNLSVISDGGNIIFGLHSYQHGHLISVMDGYGVWSVGYQYDGFGQLAMRATGGYYNPPATLYNYDPSGHLLEETAGNSNGTTTAIVDHVWLDDQPLALITPSSGQRYFIYNDHRGAPERILDQYQNVVWSANYRAFGAENVSSHFSETGVTNSLRLPGQYADIKNPETVNNAARDYFPALGRFLQSDPIGLAGGLNTYAYAGSNPFNQVDPIGLAQVGDIVFFNWYGKDWPGHSTIVTAVDANGNATRSFGAWSDSMTFHEVDLSVYKDGGSQQYIIGYGSMNGLTSYNSLAAFIGSWNGRAVANNWGESNNYQGLVCIDATTAHDGWGGDKLRDAMADDFDDNPGNYHNNGGGNPDPDKNSFYRKNDWLRTFFQDTGRYTNALGGK